MQHVEFEKLELLQESTFPFPDWQPRGKQLLLTEIPKYFINKAHYLVGPQYYTFAMG